MASNSAAVKTWCITLISAVIVFASDKNHPDAMWIALIPLILCFVLDAYYLGLERTYRQLYNTFVANLHAGKAKSEDLFLLTLKNYGFWSFTLKSTSSFSIWPFYGLTLIMLIIFRRWIF